MSGPKSERPLVERARPWVLMTVGVILVFYSLVVKETPAILLLGCSMIGGVPLDLAGREIHGKEGVA
jgi:hypothetical protein